MGKHAKYEIQFEDFKPVNFDKVRWLKEEDFHYMNEFCGMILETWNSAKKRDSHTAQLLKIIRLSL